MNAKPSTASETITPRIYVACLAAYNAGIPHGRWLDVTTVEELSSGIANILASSPIDDAKDWAIRDCDGFGPLNLSEHEALDHIVALAAFITEHGELGQLLLAEYNGDITQATNTLENYHGEYATVADFAEELHTDQLADLPNRLAHYINWEFVARDLEISGDITVLDADNGNVHVFWGH